MFTPVDSPKTLFTRICVLFVFVVLSVIGCSKSNVPPPRPPNGQIQKLQRENTELKKQVNRLESELSNSARQLDGATKRNRTLEQQVEQAKTDNSSLESELSNSARQLDRTTERNRTLEQQVEQAKTDNSSLELKVSNLNSRLNRENKALEEKVNEVERNERAISNLRGRLARAESKADETETLAQQNVQLKDKIKEVEAAVEELKKKIALVPQAEIISVNHRHGKKGFTQGLRINGTFRVSNRKGHKVKVIALFYFLADRKEVRSPDKDHAHEGQVAALQEFMPKSTSITNEQFELFIPYNELHVSQTHDLKYEVRIYDETTESFLEVKPHSKPFRYNPFAE